MQPLTLCTFYTNTSPGTDILLHSCTRSPCIRKGCCKWRMRSQLFYTGMFRRNYMLHWRKCSLFLSIKKKYLWLLNLKSIVSPGNAKMNHQLQQEAPYLQLNHLFFLEKLLFSLFISNKYFLKKTVCTSIYLKRYEMSSAFNLENLYQYILGNELRTHNVKMNHFPTIETFLFFKLFIIMTKIISAK